MEKPHTSSTGFPRAPLLFLLIALPLLIYRYPQSFDWRYTALLLAASAAGALPAVRLHRHDAVRFWRKPWFAMWAGYALALSAPGLLFHLFFGLKALPAEWTPFWSNGSFALNDPIDILTDALLLASVPGVLALFFEKSSFSLPKPAQPAEFSACVVPQYSPLKKAGEAVGVLAVFSGLAYLLSQQIPAGAFLSATPRVDVMLNVWNHWWFKKALFDPSLSILNTDYIYQPYGVSLLWHTLGPVNCLIGLAYQSLTGADAIATYNFVAFLSFALMGTAGYYLGRRVGCPTVGFFAGFALAFCGAHLGQVREGHLGLMNAQWIIFFFLFVLKTFERGRLIDALLAGVFWALAFYTHFYHAIFCGLIFGIMASAYAMRIGADSEEIRNLLGRVRNVLSRRPVLLCLLLLCPLAFWPEGRWHYWLILCGFAVIAVYSRKIAATFAVRPAWTLALPPLIFAAAALPWLIPMYLQNRATGGQLDWGRLPQYYAMDLLGYVVPSPVSRGASYFEFVWSRFLIPAGDSSAFVGFPVIVLAIYGLLKNRRPYWLFMAATFGLLSLGPVLHIAGARLTLDRLPYAALDAMPFLSASGVAGRYSMPATIAIVMLACAGLSRLMQGIAGSKRWLLGTAAVVPLILLSYPRLEQYDPPRPGFLQQIKADRSNRVVLPVCPVDTAIWFQTFHEKKMIHGFASRVPKQAKAFVASEPVFHEIRHGLPLPCSRNEAIEHLKKYDVGWIIVSEWKSERMRKIRRTIEAGLGLELVAVDDGVYLYRVP